MGRYDPRVHAFDVLGDPVRRRILELLADGEHAAGAVGAVVQAEFGISQPAVSQHLRVLREHGFATVRADGPRRLYAVDPAPPPPRPGATPTRGSGPPAASETSASTPSAPSSPAGAGGGDHPRRRSDDR